MWLGRGKDPEQTSEVKQQIVLFSLQKQEYMLETSHPQKADSGMHLGRGHIKFGPRTGNINYVYTLHRLVNGI